MKTIKIKNTRKLGLKGKPSSEVTEFTGASKVAISPMEIPFIKPKLLVKVGDRVKVGTPLYFDKTDDKLIGVSTASGVVDEIVYGPRRVIEYVVIKQEGAEFEHFDTNEAVLEKGKEAIREALIKSGLWGSIRQFPFMNVPKTNADLPKSIYVSIDDDEPHKPKSNLFVGDKREEFLLGVKVLQKLFDQVNLSVAVDNKVFAQDLGVVTHLIEGAYPANNAGAFLFGNKQDASENKSCTIEPQEIIKIGHLFKTGQYLNTKMIVLAGSLVQNPRHIRVQEGISIDELLAGEQIDPSEDIAFPHRMVAGGVFKGRKIKDGGYLVNHEYALHVLSTNLKQDMFGFMRPGFKKFTLSRAYLSFLTPAKEVEVDTSLYGEDRSCISCGICATVCPAQTFPQEMVKAIGANRRQEALELGMLDCTDCGLCTYACPSKVELSDIVKQAKDSLFKELNA